MTAIDLIVRVLKIVRSGPGPFPVYTNSICSFLFKDQRPGPGANTKFGLLPPGKLCPSESQQQ